MLMRQAPLTLWESDGTYDITVVSGTKYWFTVDANGRGQFTADANIQPSYWFEIPLNNADHLGLQYQSKLEVVSTITACTASDLEIAAQGMMYVDPSDADLQKPHATFAANAPSATHGAPAFSPFPLFVTRMSWGRLSADVNAYSSQNAQGDVTIPHQRGAIFIMGGTGEAPHAANRNPVTTDYPGWKLWVHARSAYQDNAGLGYQDYPQISGYQKAWVAISHTTSFTGAGPVRIKGKLVALRYTKGPVS